MKVSELINALSNLDGDLEVYCYVDSPTTTLPENYPGPFDPLAVERAFIANASGRSEQGLPMMRFCSEGPEARAVALIDITADF